MILEYKSELNYDGQLCPPPWVKIPGYFQDPDTFTLIGFSPSIREYKIPDTVTKLTLQEAIDRVLDINTRYPMKKIDTEVFYTDAEIETMVIDVVNMFDIS
jgi:hypothetical protein